MNKRKLELNDIKKQFLRGRKYKTITTRYEIALSYFKQKDVCKQKIFSIYFEKLIIDLLEQLTNAQLVYKLQNSLQEDIYPVEVDQNLLKVGTPFLKFISKEYPIQQIVQCLSIKKDIKKKTLSMEVQKNKLMVFFKQLKIIYPEFCFCVGQKTIIEDFDLGEFYQIFKTQWAKIYERGRISNSQKIIMHICRSFYFMGALIENNIFQNQHEKMQRKKKQEITAADETKSQKKKNVKGITYPVSSTYSFVSYDLMSTFSSKMKSQMSNEQDFSKNEYSQKSERILPRHRSHLWQKAEIGDLKIKIGPQTNDTVHSEQRVEVDLLSNDVENILIEHAFKIQKLKDACEKNNNREGVMNPYEAYQNYYHYPYYHNYQMGYQGYYQPNIVSEDPGTYYSRRSFNFTNLVQVRKTQSRLGGNKYS